MLVVAAVEFHDGHQAQEEIALAIQQEMEVLVVVEMVEV
tara:strand:+ start:483 stop:599 length:117 start_codon:yes stop_codon:yes gene_type:complete